MNCLGIMLAISMHLGLERDYNEVHPHARCTIDNTIVGLYYNSESKISSYAGYSFDLPWNVDLEVGLVTGYSGATIAPLLRIIKDNWFITPAYEIAPYKNMGLTIGYEFKIK